MVEPELPTDRGEAIPASAHDGRPAAYDAAPPLDERVSDDLSDADFADLLRELEGRMRRVRDQHARLRLLLDAVVSMAGDLSLDGVLTRIVAIASRLVGSSYAALGVLGDEGDKKLRTFIHHGIDDETAVRIGDLPRGHGVLGLLIDRPEPLRLHDLTEHPDSYGFPPNHPPMHSFLGVPVRIANRVVGNLYLTEKVGGGDFTASDEEVLLALAAAAGTAIDNARLYEEANKRESWLRATAEITTLLSGTASSDEALQLIADKAREVALADVAWIAVDSGTESLTLRSVSGVEAAPADLSPLSMENSLSQEVVETGETISTGDVAGTGRRIVGAVLPGWPTIGSAIVVPLGSAAPVRGALALGWTREHAERHRQVVAELPGNFAHQAALALQVARGREDQQRVIVLEERDRIARDLHDLVIQRLFAVGLSLQATGRLLDRPDLTDRVDQAVGDIDATIRDIRRTIFALGTPESGTDVQSEVMQVVDRAVAALTFRPQVSFEGPVRTLIDDDLVPDLMAVVGEALSNVARHAAASSASVCLEAAEDVVLTVTDDGCGIGVEAVESGLANLRWRAERRGGSFTVESVLDEGTRLTWSVPND